MINLFLTIFLIVFLFLAFQYFKKFNVNSFQAIVINYYTCILTGMVMSDGGSTEISIKSTWIQLAVFTGALFPASFYLMGLTVQKVNISVATVANKMSLAIPIMFSFIYLRRGPEEFSILNITGIVLALIAIAMTSYKEFKSDGEIQPRWLIFLMPASVFLLGGIIDLMINYINYAHLTEQNRKLFPLIMFSIAGLIGTVILIINYFVKKEWITKRELLAGIILGVPNYFSLYFFLRTFTYFGHDASIVFPLVNIGVIIGASLLAVILFKDRLSGINLIGICLAIISIILLFS